MLNAQRTRKILTGPLSGIEKLESGWTVAVTYFNGYRILIPMSEMMINLKGDGRENADTLNRQVRIANNMLGADIDFIIKDLDEASRSVVTSRKDAMLRKQQIFYFTENEEEQPMVYQGRIVEARVIAVAPKAVRLEVFGVECSVRARDMAWEWMPDATEKFQVGDLVLVCDCCFRFCHIQPPFLHQKRHKKTALWLLSVPDYLHYHHKTFRFACQFRLCCNVIAISYFCNRFSIFQLF